MRLGVVTKSRFYANPPVCEKCKKTVQIGEWFYQANQSKKKYCRECGDKLYQ